MFCWSDFYGQTVSPALMPRCQKSPETRHIFGGQSLMRDINTTVSTWHEEMILLAHTSYLFAQCRIGTYPPFWALGCSPMQEHINKLEFVTQLRTDTRPEFE